MNNSRNPFTQAGSARWFDVALFLIVATGFILRLLAFASSRDMWIDELTITNNIIRLPFLRILEPLNAPIGFMVVQKALSLLFPIDEMTFRLFPCVCGLGALYLMTRLCPLLLSRGATLVVMLAFSLSPELVYYSGEAKQYSGDLFFAIVIMILALRWPCSREKGALLFSVIVIVAQLFSHTALFMTCAMFFYLLISKKGALRSLLPLILVTIGMQASLYYFSYNRVVNQIHMQQYWEYGFPPESAAQVPVWFYGQLTGIVCYLSVSFQRWLALVLLILGSGYWLVRNPKVYLFLILGLLQILAGAFLHAYPFSGSRLSIFLAPSVFIVLAGFVEAILLLLQRRPRLTAVFLLALLTLVARSESVGLTKIPNESRRTHDARDVVFYLADRSHPDDLIITDFSAREKIIFYWNFVQVPMPELLELESQGSILMDWNRQKLSTHLKGRRVWYWQRYIRYPYLHKLQNCIAAARPAESAVAFAKHEVRLYDMKTLSPDEQVKFDECHAARRIEILAAKQN